MFASFVVIYRSQVESIPYRANIGITGLEDGDVRGSVQLKDILQYFVRHLKGQFNIPENAENYAQVLRSLSIKPLPSNIQFRGSGSIEMSDLFVLLSQWAAKLFNIPEETMNPIKEKIAKAGQKHYNTDEHDMSNEYENKFWDKTRKKPKNNIVVRV